MTTFLCFATLTCDADAITDNSNLNWITRGWIQWIFQFPTPSIEPDSFRSWFEQVSKSSLRRMRNCVGLVESSSRNRFSLFPPEWGRERRETVLRFPIENFISKVLLAMEIQANEINRRKERKFFIDSERFAFWSFAINKEIKLYWWKKN